MRAREILRKHKPTIYLDMDGVLANFFAEYAVLAGLPRGSSYRDVPSKLNGPTLDKMIGTDFFYSLPKFPTADALVNYVVKLVGSYSILSSPLRGDYENSKYQKILWIKEHLDPQPAEIIIESNKAKYAKTNGIPNILVDDRGSNITAWEAAGGIGIKYQADEDNLRKVFAGISRAVKIINGEKEHIPQKLSSLDRGSMIKVHSSGDVDQELREGVIDISKHKDLFVEIFKNFLPLAMHYIGLNSLPKMKFETQVHDEHQPTFGRYVNGEHVLHIALLNRHPNDILRTLAHELVHYKQDLEGQLDDTSGETGSPEENQAHEIAGIVMRHFNKKYPKYLSSKPITESWQTHIIGCVDPKGVF